MRRGPSTAWAPNAAWPVGPGAPAPYIASGYLLFDTIEDFQGSFGPHTEKIVADIPNYTPVQPVLAVSEITL